MGRIQGAAIQKEHAADTQRKINEIHNDLLRNPESARWGLDRRAAYILTKLNEWEYKQPNGKPYAVSTIKQKIIGKG